MALSRPSYKGYRRWLAGLTAILLVLAMTGPGLAALAFAEEAPAEEAAAAAVEAPAPAPETPAPEAPEPPRQEPKIETPAEEPAAAPAEAGPAADPVVEVPAQPATQDPAPRETEPSVEPLVTVESASAQAFTGHVTARKYNDSDGDGSKDSGEAYISGWEFVLTEYTSASYSSVTRTITKSTDSNGLVDFRHDDSDSSKRLTAGYYKLAEGPGPVGQTWVCTDSGTTSGFQLTDASSSRDCGTFGNQQLTNLISGHKYGDVDNSDAADASGPVLSGWTISLYKKNGSNWSVADSVVTGSDGVWSFSAVTPGQYYVQETLQTGWTQKHRPAYYDGTHYMTVTASSQFTGLDFFNYKPADVTVFKFRDVDANGSYESHTDSALNNVGFTLTGPNSYSSHIHTNSSGNAVWSGLAAGDYTLTETLPSGLFAPAGTVKQFTLAMGESRSMQIANVAGARVDVFKFRDVDANGSYESHTDSALNNVGFTLTGPNSYSSHIHTNSSGNVSWSDLAPGDYTLTEAVPSGMSAPAGAVTQFTLSAGETKTLRIANVTYARVDVFKFEDVDGDGEYDGGHDGHGTDSAIGDVGFTLTGPMGYESHKHTGSDGDVSWTDLAPGSYTLSEILPGGLYAPEGADRELTLTTGHTESLEIPNIEYATVNIFKFNDLNGDGTRQEGEPALAGRSFTLTGPDCDRTDITDSEGDLTFADLKIGDYTLVENNMSGWFSKPEMPMEFTLSSGQTWSRSVGNIEAGKVVVRKYNDLDGDEVRDEGEPALAREFELTGEDGSVTGVTDATTGEYTFVDLPAGDYTLQETAVDHWAVSGGLPSEPFSIGVGQTKTFEVGNREIVRKTWKLDYANHPEGATFRVDYVVDGEEAASVGLDDDTLEGSVEVTAVATIDSWEWVATLDGQDYLLGSGSEEIVTKDTVNEFEYDASVSGVKFEDLNANGTQDPGEPGLSGWQIEIYRRSQVRIGTAGSLVMESPGDVPDGYVLAGSTTTDNEGAYEFSGLLPGSYRLASVTPQGWQRTISPGDVQVGDGVSLQAEDFGYADPDLGVEVSASPSRAASGADVVYTIRYFNAGKGAATDFTVLDAFDPDRLEVIDAAGGTVTSGRIAWQIAGPLAGGASGTLTVRMRLKPGLPAGMVVDNTATIAIAQVTDATAGDNTSAAHVTVTGGVLLPHTGMDMWPLLLLALVLGVLGLTMRRMAVREE